jgi:hypothetical protein
LAISHIWSCVWIAFDVSWNARWDSIIATIASATSTFEASSAPCSSVVVAGAGRAAPDSGVTRNALSPTGCSPCGERTETSSIRPICRPAAVRVPSRAIETWLGSVPAGTLTGGWTSAPDAVTRRPPPSTRSEPSRVSAWRPSASRMRMKPSP